ncbi:hypothetical protein [Brevibacterium atlanticum]|uniref:hypothetical protein n=1 Tax=Brevibacterium atlanticum TaxID=2697563 RepID=UPI00141F1534|nr:hypothetical protein [Brevibacterium atlanticum]
MSDDFGPSETPLFLRTFANRKCTSLTATLVLDAGLTALWFWLTVFECTWPPVILGSAPPSELILLAGFGVANALLYPFSREIYFRATAFIPRVIAWGGSPLWMTFGLLLLIVRFAAFIYTWLLAIPLGLVGLVYLTWQERAGRGYRIVS